MAHRIGAGGHFQSIDRTDEDGFLLARPSGTSTTATGKQPLVYLSDSFFESDSDETAPPSYCLPRQRLQHWGLGQRHDRVARGGGTPLERDCWSSSPSPSPEPQFFIIRESTPATAFGPPPPPPPPPPPTKGGGGRGGEEEDEEELQHIQLCHQRQQQEQEQQQQRRHQQHHHHHHEFQHNNNKNNNSNSSSSQQPPRENARSPVPIACFMQRTDSGRGILTAADGQLPSSSLPSSCCEFSPEDDLNAASRVAQHMKWAKGKVKRHERILRALIHPKAHADKRTDFELDNAALESIFSAADEIFFYGRLSHRVHWEWSSGCVDAPQGGGGGGGGGGGAQGGDSSKIIGTTALRKASPPHRDGYETLIVLSSPILRNTSYNRRLLISTFLHELIHSYLFICCGFKARHCGGHTPGFGRIAALIDQWEGHGTLRLCDIEADLEWFREEHARGPAVHAYQPNHPSHPYQHHQHPPPPPPHHHDRPRPHNNNNNNNNNHQHHHHHHHGGVDFHDFNATPWSAGPKMVFSAHHHQHQLHHQATEAHSWAKSSSATQMTGVPYELSPIISSPLSSTTTLVDYDVCPEAVVPQPLDMQSPMTAFYGKGMNTFFSP